MADSPNLLPNLSGVFTQPQQFSIADLLKLADWQNSQKQSQSAPTQTPSTTPGLPPEITTGKSATASVSTPSQYVDLFNQTESKYGLPSGYLHTTAGIESSYNPRSYNELSKAAGLFQFIPGTAKEYGLKNPYDAAASTEAAAQYAAKNQQAFYDKFGKMPTAGELYMMHQQGTDGAIKLFSNPDARAGNIVGTKAITANGGSANMTSGQFTQMWNNRFSARAPVAAAAYSGDDAKSAFDQYRKKPPQQPAPQQTSAPESNHPDIQSAHDTFAQYKRPEAASKDFAERFAPVEGQSSLDVRGDTNQKGTVSAAMQKKFDPYAGLSGLEHVWSEGKKEKGDMLQETIRWAKRNPELAGGAAAIGAYGAYEAGPALASMVAAAPVVRGGIKVAGKILSSPGVQMGLTEVGLGHVADLLHGVHKVGSGIGHLLGME